MNILITGGAGFVGSTLAIKFKKEHSGDEVIAFDNLKRRGSEINISRLKENGIRFIHGDIRNKEDFGAIEDVDVLIECSAESSVMAGYEVSPEYTINTNLLGAVNCFEYARKCDADVIFLSSSRVYPINTLNEICLYETATRYNIKELFANQPQGISVKGVTENVSLNGARRTLYGSTKLASELILQEYIEMYRIRGIINRCGVLAGPGQMGKVDQGFVSFWVAKHHYKQPLSYFGFGGQGKQVRDILHVDDLYRLLDIQINDISIHTGEIYNVGGGVGNSISLLELTSLCQQSTGNIIEIDSIPVNRPGDIQLYITDNSKVTRRTGWKPEITVNQIIEEITIWIENNSEMLRPILA